MVIPGVTPKMMEFSEFNGTGNEWNQVVAAFPQSHFLQTWEWSQLKSAYGWRPLPLLWKSAAGELRGAAMVLERSEHLWKLPIHLRLLYVPRGPLLTSWSETEEYQQVLTDLVDFARQRSAMFIKFDAEVPLGTGMPGEADEQTDPAGAALALHLQQSGWRFSQDQVQFRNTVLVDLAASEDELLARMKQKTRYNIRLASRKGVVVRPASVEDIPLLYRMYAVTSLRDGFVIRDEAYYQKVWGNFMAAGLAEGLVAEVASEPVGAVIIFRFASRAWYVYGMSLDVHREKMPAYLLQWEAMRRARAGGCQVYDLWGAPDVFDESDSMWGVYRFKSGLGGTLVRTIGAWDYPLQVGLYNLYTHLLPRLLDILRWRGRSQTRAQIEA
jgi:peptidoglycan pentaglycine glycine transferase (the first glycine)